MPKVQSKLETIIVHGKTFNVEKRGKEWQTNYRNFWATKGTTKVEAIKALQEYDKDKLVKSCDHVDKQLDRDKYFAENTERFTATFGFPPPRDYMMYMCGCGMQLDVIALDKKLRTPDGISTNDYILNTYGQSALDMVKRMI